MSLMVSKVGMGEGLGEEDGWFGEGVLGAGLERRGEVFWAEARVDLGRGVRTCPSGR